MFSRSRIRRPSITSFRRMGAKVLRGEGAPPRPVVVHEPHVGVGESARQEEHGLHREGHNSEGNVRPGRRRESSPSIPFEPFSRVSCFGFPIENSARISSSIPQARTCGSPTGPWKRGRRTDAGAAAREGRDPGEPAFDEVPSGQLRGPQPLPSDEHLPGRAVFDHERDPCGRQGTPFASFSSHSCRGSVRSRGWPFTPFGMAFVGVPSEAPHDPSARENKNIFKSRQDALGLDNANDTYLATDTNASGDAPPAHEPQTVRRG